MGRSMMEGGRTDCSMKMEWLQKLQMGSKRNFKEFGLMANDRNEFKGL